MEGIKGGDDLCGSKATEEQEAEGSALRNFCSIGWAHAAGSDWF